MSLVLVDKLPNQILRITLNRPEKRNALSIALMEELLKAIDQVTEKTRLVLFEGKGEFFCAGLDLSEAENDRGSELVAAVLKSITQIPCATLAYVHGGAMAGGLGLMAACDLAIASRNSFFSLPELRRGLIPALVHQIISSQVPKKFLQELIFLGEPITAVHAHTIGLINTVITHEEKDNVIGVWIEYILKAAPNALKTYKKNFLHSDSFDKALTLHKKVKQDQEAKEGIDAFLDKRHPYWSL